MKRMLPAISQGMLILGGLMILAGLGWGLWVRLNPPPPPVISDEGAVVLAVTASFLATTATPEPTISPATDTPEPTPSAAPSPRTIDPTPAILPDWTVTPNSIEVTPTSFPSTPLPASSTATRTSTPVPKAEEPPTRIVAPAIELDANVEPMGWEMIDHEGTMVSEWIVPRKAAGWHINSALPGHGENVVLSGHHNIEGKVFRYVVDLEPGDEVTLYVGDTPYRYIVTEKYILKEAGMPLSVRQKNAQWIRPTGDERLTLVTCWPYEWPGNSHRVIVVARPPEYFEPITIGDTGIK